MGRFHQDWNFACFVSLLKTISGLLWPNLICYARFFLLFCGEQDFLIILPRPLLPINSLQCIQNSPKMHCWKWCKTVHFWGILNALQCIVVNRCRVGAEGLALHRTIQNGHSNRGPAKFLKSDTKRAKFLSWGNLPICWYLIVSLLYRNPTKCPQTYHTLCLWKNLVRFPWFTTHFLWEIPGVHFVPD